MGRKSVKKERISNPKRRKKYLLKLMPIFYEYGLQQLSMDDISSKLQVSKPTLYNYFASKEEMVADILSHILGEIAPFAKVLSDKQKPYMDRYFNAIQILTRALSGISNLVLSDIKIYYPELFKQVEVFREYAAGELEMFYAEGKSNGILSGYNTNILVLSDRLFFDALTQPEVLEANNLSLKQAFQEYFKLKCFGMLSSVSRSNLEEETIELLDSVHL